MCVCVCVCVCVCLDVYMFICVYSYTGANICHWEQFTARGQYNASLAVATSLPHMPGLTQELLHCGRDYVVC